MWRRSTTSHRLRKRHTANTATEDGSAAAGLAYHSMRAPVEGVLPALSAGVDQPMAAIIGLGGFVSCVLDAPLKHVPWCERNVLGRETDPAAFGHCDSIPVVLRGS